MAQNAGSFPEAITINRGLMSTIHLDRKAGKERMTPCHSSSDLQKQTHQNCIAVAKVSHLFQLLVFVLGKLENQASRKWLLGRLIISLGREKIMDYNAVRISFISCVLSCFLLNLHFQTRASGWFRCAEEKSCGSEQFLLVLETHVLGALQTF